MPPRILLEQVARQAGQIGQAKPEEMPTLPPFHQHSFYIAYQEGWGLYSEQCGVDAGFYRDPYSLYGHLQDDLLRAIRLVVDTGFHFKKWSRQEVVDYFHQNSGLDEPTVQSETDRYMAWPAQALGYKVGQLALLSLPEKARRELGPRFDIRAFHDEVLTAGALPLDVLAKLVDSWIARSNAASAARRPHGAGVRTASPPPAAAA